MKTKVAIAFSLILTLLLSLCPALAAPEVVESFCDESEWENLKLANIARVEEGLMPLSTFPQLQGVANTRSEELLEQYSHLRPDGRNCYTALDEAELFYTYAGENIAHGYPNALTVHEAWMNSPGHRSNILGVNYLHLSVGEIDNHWAQFFIGGCEFTAMEVIGILDSCEAGTAIDDMGAAVVLTCDQHGESYFPLIGGICSGYDPDLVGEPQTVTVTLEKYGLSAEFDVTLEQAAPEHSPFDYSISAEEAADYLNSLGMFNGTDKGYELERVPNRMEAVTMLVRMLGMEEYAAEQQYAHPFTDVQEWASPNVGYAYANGLTNGTGDTTFGAKEDSSCVQYITFVLRALGYSDADGDFVWNRPWELSDAIGLTIGQYDSADTPLTRGDMVLITCAALECRMADGSATLGEVLFGEN